MSSTAKEIKYQVFVSSTFSDLIDERREVINTILELNHIPVSMEFFPASDKDQWTVIQRLLDTCDYYVIIVAGKYGSVDNKTGKSYTQLEYEYALEKKIPIMGLLHKDITKLPLEKRENNRGLLEKIESFKGLVRSKMCKFWESQDQLGKHTATSLPALIRENPRQGWVRASMEDSVEMVRSFSVTAETQINLQPKTDLNEFNLKLAFDSALLTFASFIEYYFIIEGLYSHSNKSDITLDTYWLAVKNNKVPAHLSNINELWRRAYKSIHQFIQIREYSKKNVDGKEFELICGFYISCCYFYLSELWGAVPYIDSPLDTRHFQKIPQKTTREIKTISASLLNLSMLNGELSDTSKNLIIYLLAKWELRDQNYEQANFYLELLLNSKYVLAPKEEIFNTRKESLGGFDTEKGHNIFNDRNFNVLCKKGRFVHYSRYTEIILLASEVNYKLNNRVKALEYLNLVKKRNKRPVVLIDENFTLSLLEEWKLDLGMEGNYFSFLKRNGLAQELLGISDYQLILPIPQQEIDLNPNIRQNYGY